MPSAPDSLSGRPLIATPSDQANLVDPQGAAARLLDAVNSRYNILLLGERGMGKTSQLHHLSHRTAKDRAVRTVYVDAGLATNAVEFLELVRYALGRKPNELGEMLTNLSRSMDVRHPLPEVGRLLQLIRSIGEVEDHQPRSRTTVVLADGLAAQIAQSVFGRLRDELWQLPLRWVVSGDAERRGDYLRPPADAFFDLVLALEPFEPGGQRELLKRRLGGKASSVTAISDEVLSRSGGNPRRLLAIVRDVLTSTQDSQAVLSADARWAAQLEGLTRPSRMLVAEIEARGAAVSASDNELLAGLGWTRARAAQVLRELEVAGVVESREERPVKGPGRPRKVYSLRRQTPA